MTTEPLIMRIVKGLGTGVIWAVVALSSTIAFIMLMFALLGLSDRIQFIKTATEVFFPLTTRILIVAVIMAFVGGFIYDFSQKA